MVMYFSVVYPKQSNCFLNSSANSFMDKMVIIVRSIMKNYRNFFRYTIIWITYTIRTTSIFSCIMTKISNFFILFYLSKVYFQCFLYKYNRLSYAFAFHGNFHVVSPALLLKISFFKKINHFHCVLF